MSFQSISRVTVCWAVTSSGPNAEYIDIAQDVQDYIGICDELQESCLCLTSDADKFGVHILALVPTDHDVREAGRFSTAAATTGNVCTIKLITLNAVNTLTLCIGLQGLVAHLKPRLKPGLWAFTPCKPSPSPIEARIWAGLGWALGFGPGPAHH